jgi:hypothetical protein
MPKLIVLGTKNYDFENDKGDRIKGSKAFAFTQNNDGEIVPEKISFQGVNAASSLFPVPGIYEVMLGFRNKIEDSELLKELDLKV